MTDLNIAKQEFIEGDWSLVIVKDGCVLQRLKEHRLVPLLRALHAVEANAQGCSVADKVIGRAAAMLLISYGARAIYTPLMSEEAKRLLETASIDVIAEELVPHILDNTGQDLCPMEKLVADIQQPTLGLKRLLQFFHDKGIPVE